LEELEKNKNEILTLYNAIPKESEDNMKHYVDLRDIKIESREDLVKTCQVFRNPRFETFRFIYMRGNEIVNYESVTSRLPNSCDIFKVKGSNDHRRIQKGLEEISRRMYRLGADGYYLMHNHPAGKAKASLQDIGVTRLLVKNIKGFKGHLIVDHGTYAWVSADESNHSLTAHNYIPIDFIPDIYSDKLIIDDPLMHKKINNRNELARIMYDVKHANHYSCLVLTSANSYIRLFQEVPNTFINMNYRQIGGYIKNRCLDTGSIRAFLATTDRPFFERAKELVKLGYASDCVAYTITKDKAEIVETADNEYVDQNLFNSIKESDEKRKAKQDSERQERS